MRIPETIELITVMRVKDQNGIDQKTEESKPVTKQEVKATGVTLDYSSVL